MSQDDDDLRAFGALLAQRHPHKVITKLHAVLLRLEADGRTPSWSEMGKVGKVALAQTMLERTEGNQSEAARQLGVSRNTLLASLELKIEDAAKLCEDQPVKTFDDSQFPFTRVQWEEKTTIPFLIEYRDWMIKVIIPRAIVECKKIVALDNCSEWTRFPPARVLRKSLAITREIESSMKQHTLGIVRFTPNMKWATWFNPILKLTSIPAKFANAEDQAINFARQYFQNAGVTPPEELSLY